MVGRIALEIGRQESREFGQPITLRRVECSCGWRGQWFTLDVNLQRSICDHLDEHHRAA